VFYYIFDITGGFPYYIKYKKKLSSLDIIISSSDRLSSFFILRSGKSSSYYDDCRNGAGVRPQTHGEAPLSAGVERMDIYLYTQRAYSLSYESSNRKYEKKRENGTIAMP